MAEKLLMLALSPTMETGIIAKWVKKEGESFSSGDVLCEIETDKTTMEYEASDDGVLLKILLQEGRNASVGEPIAITGKQGEDISALLAEALTGGSGTTAGTKTGGAKTDVSAAASGRQIAAEITPSSVRSSPLARKIAQNAGIDINTIQGSGPEGRVVKRDIEKASAVSAGIPAIIPEAVIAPLPEDEILPVSGKRKIIAQRLSESMFSAPHYYLKLRVEMDGIMQARKQLIAAVGDKVSMNTFLIKFVAEALKKHPVINSTWNGATITRHRSIDIGLAVARTDGLITPVVRNCGGKGILEIERELKELIQKAQSETLKPAEYTGATFTISNLGSYGIEEFTAIINPPGSAILAVGEIKKEQVVDEDNSVSIKSNMKLTLSCDHRVIDGAAGAAFMAELKNIMQEPIRVLY